MRTSCAGSKGKDKEKPNPQSRECANGWGRDRSWEGGEEEREMTHGTGAREKAREGEGLLRERSPRVNTHPHRPRISHISRAKQFVVVCNSKRKKKEGEKERVSREGTHTQIHTHTVLSLCSLCSFCSLCSLRFDAADYSSFFLSPSAPLAGPSPSPPAAAAGCCCCCCSAVRLAAGLRMRDRICHSGIATFASR